MKSTKKYVISTVLATILCTAVHVSAMEEPTTSGERSVTYPVSEKNAKMLKDTLKTLNSAVTTLDEVRKIKEKAKPYNAKTIANIQQQRKIYIDAIELATSMYLGENPVNMNRINEQLEWLKQYPI